VAQRCDGYTISGLAASLTHSDSLLTTANKEATLIHSQKIAKDAKAFALPHVHGGEEMLQGLKATRFSRVCAKYKKRNTD
jgi:hypothetical protein